MRVDEHLAWSSHFPTSRSEGYRIEMDAAWEAELPSDVSALLASLQRSLKPTVGRAQTNRALAPPPSKATEWTPLPKPQSQSKKGADTAQGEQQSAHAMRHEIAAEQSAHQVEAMQSPTVVACTLCTTSNVERDELCQRLVIEWASRSLQQDLMHWARGVFSQAAHEVREAQRKLRDAEQSQIDAARAKLASDRLAREATDRAAAAEQQLKQLDARLEALSGVHLKLAEANSEKIDIQTRLSESEAEQKQLKRTSKQLQKVLQETRSEIANLTARHEAIVADYERKLTEALVQASRGVQDSAVSSAHPQQVGGVELEQLRDRLISLSCDSDRFHALRHTLDEERSKVRAAELNVITLTNRLHAREKEVGQLKNEANEQRHVSRELGLCRGKLVNAERRISELQAKLQLGAPTARTLVSASVLPPSSVGSDAGPTSGLRNLPQEMSSSVSSVEYCGDGRQSSLDVSAELVAPNRHQPHELPPNLQRLLSSTSKR